MTEKTGILKRLDQIDFHDIPVEQISFQTEPSTELRVDFALYVEEKEDYDHWTLQFGEVQELKSEGLHLNVQSDFEIYRFDYVLHSLFECKLLFLLGLGQSSYEVNLTCKNIELHRRIK